MADPKKPSLSEQSALATIAVMMAIGGLSPIARMVALKSMDGLVASVTAGMQASGSMPLSLDMANSVAATAVKAVAPSTNTVLDWWKSVAQQYTGKNSRFRGPAAAYAAMAMHSYEDNKADSANADSKTANASMKMVVDTDGISDYGTPPASVKSGSYENDDQWNRPEARNYIDNSDPYGERRENGSEPESREPAAADQSFWNGDTRNQVNHLYGQTAWGRDVRGKNKDNTHADRKDVDAVVLGAGAKDPAKLPPKQRAKVEALREALQTKPTDSPVTTAAQAHFSGPATLAPGATREEFWDKVDAEAKADPADNKIVSEKEEAPKEEAKKPPRGYGALKKFGNQMSEANQKKLADKLQVKSNAQGDDNNGSKPEADSKKDAAPVASKDEPKKEKEQTAKNDEPKPAHPATLAAAKPRQNAPAPA